MASSENLPWCMCGAKSTRVGLLQAREVLPVVFHKVNIWYP
jgi:hypothetical protein